MKPYLIDLVETADSPLQGKNQAREYLQAQILSQLQSEGAMVPLAFQGGTALRFLYSIPRYSEDLNFALERPSRGYDFRDYLKRIKRAFTKMGYQVDLKYRDQKTVHSAFVRFPGLLFGLGLSPHENEVLAVKLEVDTKPPQGAELETTIIRRHILLHLQHHDRGSLLAGKLHALLQREYVKGRDVYDLFWYLSEPSWPEPNLVMLNHALDQTGWEGGELTAENWRHTVRKRIEKLSWDRVQDDVRPFLEVSGQIDLLTKENVLQVLEK
jgi:hypothetical protein